MPLSILTVFSVASDQLVEVFKDICNDILRIYGKKYSCEHLLMKLIDSWTFVLDENNVADYFNVLIKGL